MQLDPGLADSYSNLGNLLRRQRRIDEAITHLRAAIRINPDLAIAHNNLGGCDRAPSRRLSGVLRKQ